MRSGLGRTLRKQSAKPVYGILPAASGFIFWMRVLTKSKGREQADAKKPAIMDAVTVIGRPRRLLCSFSISLACTSAHAPSRTGRRRPHKRRTHKRPSRRVVRCCRVHNPCASSAAARVQPQAQHQQKRGRLSTGAGEAG